MELERTDIHRLHGFHAPHQEHLGKSSGRGPDIQARHSGDIEPYFIEKAIKLDSTPRYEAHSFIRKNLHQISFSHIIARFLVGSIIHQNKFLVDKKLCPISGTVVIFGDVFIEAQWEMLNI